MSFSFPSNLYRELRAIFSFFVRFISEAPEQGVKKKLTRMCI